MEEWGSSVDLSGHLVHTELFSVPLYARADRVWCIHFPPLVEEDRLS